MSISPDEFLRHVLDETIFIQRETQGILKENFLQDERLKRACVRSLEIIGEAVKKLPSSFKVKYSHVDWKAIAGMRDKLIHDYFGIDYDIVWDVIQNKIKVLATEINGFFDNSKKTI